MSGTSCARLAVSGASCRIGADVRQFRRRHRRMDSRRDVLRRVLRRENHGMVLSWLKSTFSIAIVPFLWYIMSL